MLSKARQLSTSAVEPTRAIDMMEHVRWYVNPGLLRLERDQANHTIPGLNKQEVLFNGWA